MIPLSLAEEVLEEAEALAEEAEVLEAEALAEAELREAFKIYEE